MIAFILFFFRDPERKIPSQSNAILSPADGTIMSVSDIYEDKFLHDNAVKVSIFLSLLNVHINRSPISGTVRYKAYRPGEFLPAFKSHASELNERSTIGIEAEKEDFRILVHQITGFIARRIVCSVKEGSILNAGDRFGLIKFGSCTEIILPASANVAVRPGDKVKGGISIIATID